MAINFSEVNSIKFNYYGELSYVESKGIYGDGSGIWLSLTNVAFGNEAYEITFEVGENPTDGVIWGGVDVVSGYANRILGLGIENGGIQACAGTYSDDFPQYRSIIVSNPIGTYTIRIHYLHIGSYSDNYVFDVYKDSQLINSVTIEYDIVPSIHTNVPSMAVFNLCHGSTMENYTGATNCKIYNVKQYSDTTFETVLHNFIPCRKSNGKPCMYDTITGNYGASYYPNGLLGGEWVAPITGLNQYIEVKQIVDSNSNVLWDDSPKLDYITLSGQNTVLNVNSNFLFGGTVTAHYTDGNTSDVTLDTTFTGYNMSTAGTYTVTASYTEGGRTRTATYTLSVVVKELSSITLSGETTSLYKGSAFSFGGTVTAHYTDNTTADVTSSTTFTGYNMNTAGTYTVTASYTEDGITKTATYQLTVVDGWITLWSGSKTVSVTGNSGTISGTESNFTSMPSGSGNTPRIRVTYSSSYNYGNTSIGTREVLYYNKDGNLLTSKPSSPYDMNKVVTGSDKKILGIDVNNTGGSYGCRVWLEKDYDSTNNRARFSLGANKYTNGTNQATASLTITKIEYYNG